MKDLLKIFFMICVVGIVYIYRNNISNFISDEIIDRGNNKILSYNEYYIDNDYLYVQNTDKNYADNYQDLINIFYSFINSGDKGFSFYCKYDGCLNDVETLINNDEIIANINNFVHPYNSFSSINVNITASGKVTVKTKKVYNDEKIKFVDDYINTFIQNNLNDDMTDYDKIKAFHDYVINNTIYDQENNSKFYSAYDLIVTGKSICGGYSDLMAIYLNKLGLKNYKITSKDHIWNLVYLDGVWYHIDVTWDDPVASDGKQYLIHNFFMISTDELLELDSVEHSFDKSIYIEAN